MPRLNKFSLKTLRKDLRKVSGGKSVRRRTLFGETPEEKAYEAFMQRSRERTAQKGLNNQVLVAKERAAKAEAEAKVAKLREVYTTAIQTFKTHIDNTEASANRSNYNDYLKNSQLADNAWDKVYNALMDGYKETNDELIIRQNLNNKLRILRNRRNEIEWNSGH